MCLVNTLPLETVRIAHSKLRVLGKMDLVLFKIHVHLTLIKMGVDRESRMVVQYGVVDPGRSDQGNCVIIRRMFHGGSSLLVSFKENYYFNLPALM